MAENHDPASSGGASYGELMDLRNANLALRKERHEQDAALKRLTVQLRIRDQALARAGAKGKAGGGGGGKGGAVSALAVGAKKLGRGSQKAEDIRKRLNVASSGAAYKFFAIKDAYGSLDEVSQALRAAGLESSNLIVAIDFTKSNTWTGRETYGGRSLHDTSFDNPYQAAIRIIGTVMAPYDDDNLIPVFGFGDSTTTDKSVFPFFPDRPARGFEEVLARYKELVPRVHMAGPTNFAPAIEAAIQICEQTASYHILIIIADGQVTNRLHTEAAIVRASAYPLSIILVGVGDGPWDMMEDFDDSLPERRFDNFQFVQFADVIEAHLENAEVALALACLMEIPEQYVAIRSLGLI